MFTFFRYFLGLSGGPDTLADTGPKNKTGSPRAATQPTIITVPQKVWAKQPRTSGRMSCPVTVFCIQ